MPVPERIARNFGIWQTVNQLFTLFAALGLLLAALGIYGLISRLVAQRTGEIGIRMALGAQVRDIVRLILGNGLRMAVVGAALGVIGSVFLSRFIARALPAFGSEHVMPVVSACAVLMTVAVIACFLPAHRASRVNPTEALRAE
jgi:ABC-type antimicrobial peptide transport system permease subunit